MRFGNRASLSALGLWLLSLCAPAPAQSGPGQWVDDRYLVGVVKPGGTSSDTLWTFVKDVHTVSDEIPNVTAADLPELCQTCGTGAYWAYWHGGALHTRADGGREKDGNGRESQRHVFAKWEDGGWRLVGTLRAPGGQLIQAIPCDGGRFIVVSSGTDLYDDSRRDRSPFCVVAAREGRKELAVVSSLDHGQDGLRQFMVRPDCFNLAWFSDVIVTEGRATLVHRKTGLYWVFSTETAKLVKAGGVFEGITPEMIAGGAVKSHSGVLCANPERAGTVLLSAQDENLYLAETESPAEEARLMMERVPEGQRTEGFIALVDDIQGRRLDEAKARSQLIVWYRIHPENGRLERLDSPPEGGASTRGDTYHNDYWRPMPDGSVRMGWLLFSDTNRPAGDQAPGSAAGPDAKGNAEAVAAGGGEGAPEEGPPPAEPVQAHRE